MRVKAVITDVSSEGKGPSIVVSRRNPELIRKLFAIEVPEIADKLVEIVNVAREPGYRSKIAVISHADGVDPVGACVGPRGSRVRMVVSELRGEKIDIIPFNEEPARFVAKALSPARVREVLVDDDDKQATVIVPDDQLSLAIGREGQNARLAAKLTGWRVDIKSETEFSQGDEDIDFDAEEQPDGRCAAVLSAGRRSPNAALSGSRLLRPAPAPGPVRASRPTRSPCWRRSPSRRSPRSPTPTPMTPRSPRSSIAPRPSSARRRPRPRKRRSRKSTPWIPRPRLRRRGPADEAPAGPIGRGRPAASQLRRGPPRRHPRTRPEDHAVGRGRGGSATGRASSRRTRAMRRAPRKLRRRRTMAKPRPRPTRITI